VDHVEKNKTPRWQRISRRNHKFRALSVLRMPAEEKGRLTMSNENQFPLFLTPLEAACYLSLSLSALARMRRREDGPAFARFSPRVIRYRKRELDEWMQSRCAPKEGMGPVWYFTPEGERCADLKAWARKRTWVLDAIMRSKRVQQAAE
jgi:predicted DNA-binding transcriptional regulator AlpA